MTITFVRTPEEKKTAAAHILHDLPAWFGIPESIEEYIRESARMPFWLAEEAGEPLGFIALKETSPYACEVYVMGVVERLHRQGVGRSLMQALEAYAIAEGYEYLQVKTVAGGCYEEYDRTRLFYEGCGFRPLEVFPTLWDEHNPCLIMVKRL